MIDKVARQRAKQGRFGVDHSEILNFEFELANKTRSDHMNFLVYKDKYQSMAFSELQELTSVAGNKENY